MECQYIVCGVVFNPLLNSLTSSENDIQLEPKVSSLLALFCRNPRTLLTKNLILNEVWPGVVVTDSSVCRAVSEIRRSFRKLGESEKVIRAICNRGYILDVNVKVIKSIPTLLNS